MIGQVLGWFGAGITVVVFAGMVVVYLRGAKDTGTIATLTRNNAALTERVELLEDSDLRHAETEKRQGQRINDLEAENQRLVAIRPSAEVLEAMSQFLHEHDAVAREIREIVKNGNAR